ncbi:MAG TPA: hypothetical protein VN749_15095 [Candidatus Eisenbacteria bacterium]|jgi:hypothetical protein|nr:hypothetical protein [Candidatus Eisenbacteria bacterium]
MATRIIPDEDKPSAAIEISLEKPLPDYDLHEIEQPTPRDVDSVLVSQGFRDLVDDARGVLLEIMSERPPDPTASSEITDLDLNPPEAHPLEISQVTGAICPGSDEIYRPGLWIVLHDHKVTANQPLSAAAVERVTHYADELVKRLDIA